VLVILTPVVLSPAIVIAFVAVQTPAPLNLSSAVEPNRAVPASVIVMAFVSARMTLPALVPPVTLRPPAR
jgi:hypothetical protein